jgi:hypothetical protein
MGKPRVLVVGTGFAGYHCLRTLERVLPADAADLVAVNPTDYMLYVPLLPEVAGGSLDPRRVAVPLRPKLPRTRLVQAHATGLDLSARTCTAVDVEGREQVLEWDRLVLTAGSVTRLMSIPGVAEHAFGFKSVAEAVFLRDHVLRQVELAEQADDPAERAARATFVVVGAGYTGTELVAQGLQLTRSALRGRSGLAESEVKWAARAAVRARRAGAAVARRGRAAGDQRRGGHRELREADRRQRDPDAHARVVRRRAARPVGGVGLPGHGEGAGGRRPDADRADAPARVRGR